LALLPKKRPRRKAVSAVTARFSAMMVLILFAGTSNAAANALAERPNSASSS
jgi:hypothetical protein